MAADATQNIAHEVQGLRVAAGRDLADVPDDRPTGVEVGRADGEDAALWRSRRRCPCSMSAVTYFATNWRSGALSAKSVLVDRRQEAALLEDVLRR